MAVPLDNLNNRARTSAETITCGHLIDAVQVKPEVRDAGSPKLSSIAMAKLPKIKLPKLPKPPAA